MIYRKRKYRNHRECRLIEQDEAMGRKEIINIRLMGVYTPDETTFDMSIFA